MEKKLLSMFCKVDLDQSRCNTPHMSSLAKRLGNLSVFCRTCLSYNTGKLSSIAIYFYRSDLDQSQSNTPHTAAYARRVGDLREVDLDRSQDDSLVFIESPSKKSGTKLKNQRRGESFK